MRRRAMRRGRSSCAKVTRPSKVITVPAFGFAELKAAGPHLMLMDVKKALKAGETVTW